jgi:hypothetical protein
MTDPHAQSESELGINAEDRREIEEELEQVAGRSRIAAGPEAFVIKPRRKGYVFPLVVNLVAIALTASSVLALARLFGQRSVALASSAVAVGSAEGLLLQELKQESDSKLQAKDKDIADIRTRLSTLDKERSDLAGSIDARVKAKEAELKAAAQAELDAEKKRLGSQGLSEAAIQDRLKAFEAARSAESAKQLEDERAKAAADLAQADQNYARLKEEYQKNMASLGRERASIEAEAQKRSDELRGTMEAKNRELETRSAAAEANLAKATAELASLSDSKAKAQAVEDRVLGLYGSIQAALRDGRFAEAASAADALDSYLQDPSVSSDPATRARRAADSFVAQTLGAYARSELERTSADATMLLSQAELLSAARDAAAAAQKALKTGDAALAAAKYEEALEKVPELFAAYQYFIRRAGEAQAAKDARLADSLAAADRAFRAKDLASASARYAEALGYLPLATAERDGLAVRLAELGAQKADAARGASDTAAASPLLAAANREIADARWTDAIGDFVSLIAAYPRAEEVPTALAGIQAAQAGMKKANDEAAATASANAKKAEADLSAQLSASSQRESDLKDRVADLERKLQDESSATGQAAASTSPALASGVEAAKDGQIEDLKAEVAQLQGQASAAAALDQGDKDDAGRYRALVDSYARYLSRQGSISADQGGAEKISSSSNLYSFLGDPVVAQAFPGLKDRVGSFQAAAMSEALEAFPSDAAEIAQQASLYPDKGARSAYLASRREAYSAGGDTLMTNFIDALSKTMF